MKKIIGIIVVCTLCTISAHLHAGDKEDFQKEKKGNDARIEQFQNAILQAQYRNFQLVALIAYCDLIDKREAEAKDKKKKKKPKKSKKVKKAKKAEVDKSTEPYKGYKGVNKK